MSDTRDPNAGEVLSILMERARVSPEHLALATGMSRATIYNKLQGQAWKNVDSQRFAAVFGVKPEIFLKRPVEAMLWLIENDRFELTVIDLRDGADQPSPGSGSSLIEAARLIAQPLPSGLYVDRECDRSDFQLVGSTCR